MKIGSVLASLTVSKAAASSELSLSSPAHASPFPLPHLQGVGQQSRSPSPRPVRAGLGPVPGELLAGPAAGRLQCFRGSVGVLGTGPVCTVGSRGSSGCSDLTRVSEDQKGRRDGRSQC